MQQNARVSIKALADIVSLTSPAVAERIKKLEESKVILGYTAIINQNTLERNVKAIINTTIAPEKQSTFIEFARKVDNVVCVHHVTGAYSMSISAVFKDVSELERLVKEIQRFGRTQTLVIMSTPISSETLNYFT